MLRAEQGPFALALAAVGERAARRLRPCERRLRRHERRLAGFLAQRRDDLGVRLRGPGNVALIGELPRACTLALAFGSSSEAAATLALTALVRAVRGHSRASARGVDGVVREIAAAGGATCGVCRPICVRQFQISTMVLRAHQDKTYPGAMVASLSVPWGNTKEEREGYHLVWPRDLVECAGALLAVGATREAGNTLRYLLATQLADGHWYQNQCLGGKPYWTGVQLDETALPVLLAALLDERGALEGTEVADMMLRALSYLVRHGPESDQDRWEENAGLNTFTLAACIAALVCGAEYLPADARELALAFADYWNSRLEDWTAVRDTPLARQYGIPGYYVRVAPAQAIADRGALDRVLALRNQAFDPGLPAAAQFGVDFLQLVRFGLRRPDDPLILGSVRLADALLKVDTPNGPCWHRYFDDGYGEHDDGSAYDGVGRGPRLAAAHRRARALRDCLRPRSAAAHGRDGAHGLAGGMLPEQIWDAPPIPGRGLQSGQATGSAMPLAWTHAEFVKLVASRALKRPFDRPEAVWQRYRGDRVEARRAIWAPTRRSATSRQAFRSLSCCPRPPTYTTASMVGRT